MSGSLPLRPHTIRLVIAFSAVYFIWGSTYLGMKIAILTLPPLLMGGMRFLAAGLTLLAIQAALGRVKWEWLRSPSYWSAALLTGGLMLLGANGLLAFALRLIPSGTGALVVAFTPVWLVLFDRMQTRHGMPPLRVIIGLLLGAAGVCTLAGFGAGLMGRGSAPDTAPAAENSSEAIGIGIATISTLCWALGSILGRRTPQPRALMVGASMQMIAGGVLMLLISAVIWPWTPFEWSAVSWREWGAVVYLAFAGSMVGFSSYIWLLQNTTAARASTYAYVNPMVAVLLGWIVLSERPSTRMMIAAPLILIGVVLLQWNPRRSAAAVVAQEPVTPRSTSPADDER